MATLADKDKRATIRVKNAEARERYATARMKLLEAKQKDCDYKIQQDRVLISKIDTIDTLLRAYTVNDDSISGGMEQKLKQVFDESEMQTLKDKLFQLIHQL